jgi:hypothetical protein
MPTSPKLPWHAVSIVAARSACAAACRFKGQRILSRFAPRLPLQDCSDPAHCRCVFRKHEDRREGPRREEEDTGMRRYMTPSSDRRSGRGRRQSDPE